MFDAANQARVETVDGTHEFHFVDPRQEVFIRHLHLESREMRAETEVLSDSEAEMRVRISVDSERVRVFKNLFVAIRRWVEERKHLALANLLAPEFEVLSRSTSEVNDRVRPTCVLTRRP